MKIELDNEVVYMIKDVIMVEFLKDDLDSVKKSLVKDTHPVDVKYNKKLLKAYRTVLKYYGEAYD